MQQGEQRRLGGHDRDCGLSSFWNELLLTVTDKRRPATAHGLVGDRILEMVQGQVVHPFVITSREWSRSTQRVASVAPSISTVPE